MPANRLRRRRGVRGGSRRRRRCRAGADTPCSSVTVRGQPSSPSPAAPVPSAAAATPLRADTPHCVLSLGGDSACPGRILLRSPGVPPPLAAVGVSRSVTSARAPATPSSVSSSLPLAGASSPCVLPVLPSCTYEQRLQQYASARSRIFAASDDEGQSGNTPSGIGPGRTLIRTARRRLGQSAALAHQAAMLAVSFVLAL